MVDTHEERELKFDVPDQFQLPPGAALAKAGGATASARTSTVDLASTYYDTADRSLLRHRVTLRRREGDIDTGWHLKVPHDDARTEIRLPLEAGENVPAQLAELVRGLTLGEPVRPIATVRTTRRLTSIYGGDSLLAEVADDTVHGAALGETAHLSEWREIEIELGDGGDEKLLARLGKKLVTAGAKASGSSSKLARTVGAEAPVEPARDEATQLLAEYLEEQFQVVSAGDVALRRGLDPVHKTRVGIRRLRSILRVFGPVLVPRSGVVRGRPVLVPEPARRGPGPAGAAAPVRRGDRARCRSSWSSVRSPVTSSRRLLTEQLHAREALDRGVGQRSVLGDAAPHPRPRRRPTHSPGHRGRATSSRPPTPRTRRPPPGSSTVRKAKNAELLHRARKAAKRARYAAELVAPAVGKRAEKRVERFRQLQDVLGEHQDSVQAEAILLRLGRSTGAAAAGTTGSPMGSCTSGNASGRQS